MAIEKISSAELHKVGLHYTTICNEVLKLIKSADAIAIWVYLQSQNEGWIVRPADIKNRLGLGKHRYMAAMSELRELGLCYASTVRNDQGQITGRPMVCCTVPPAWIEGFNHKSENGTYGEVNHKSDYPPRGKSDHLINNQLLNKESIDGQNEELDLEPTFDADESFNRFWKCWPNKKAKVNAKQAWDKKVDSDELAEKIITHVSDRKEVDPEWIKNNGQYIPRGATFLNGECWNDIYQVRPPPRTSQKDKAIQMAMQNMMPIEFEENGRKFIATEFGEVKAR